MWDFKPLRKDIERLSGRSQVRLIQPCLDSVVFLRGFSRFHYGEAKRLMEEVVGELPQNEVLGAMLGAFGEDEEAFDDARFKAEAHVVACVNSMHMLADAIGQVLYLGLAMNLDPALAFKNDRSINFKAVAEKLPEGCLKDKALTLTSGADFVYLAAMNNHTKHRSIVPVGYSVNLDGESEIPHGLQFKAFHYDGITYPARWVRPTLTKEYDRQETAMHEIGNALNAELAARP